VAQIHGGEDDIITFRLEGTHLFVKEGDNPQPLATLTQGCWIGVVLPLDLTRLSPGAMLLPWIRSVGRAGGRPGTSLVEVTW
jgi:hypothetical protein